MMTLIYEQIPEFEHDLKHLSRKWRSLPDDLETAKQHAIELFHKGLNPSAVFEITGCSTSNAKAYVVKKFACKALGGGAHSGIRLTYIHFLKTNRILFIELYYKGDKEVEDRGRILKYLL